MSRPRIYPLSPTYFTSCCLTVSTSGDDLSLTRLTKPAIKSFRVCVLPSGVSFTRAFPHFGSLARATCVLDYACILRRQDTWCFWHFGAARETSKGEGKSTACLSSNADSTIRIERFVRMDFYMEYRNNRVFFFQLQIPLSTLNYYFSIVKKKIVLIRNEWKREIFHELSFGNVN